MISAATLERPGRWRGAAVGGLLVLTAAPGLALLKAPAAGGGFDLALRNSAEVALIVAAISLALGWALGVAAALYEFPLRRTLLALASLPLLIPTLLPAVGWSSMAPIHGFPGCVLVFAGFGIPLVLFASLAATAGLTESQVEAARLAGGEPAAFFHAVRFVTVPAGLGALLAGVLALSDPAPGMIFGVRTAAAEILTSFAALGRWDLSGGQGSALALVVLIVVIPIAGFAAPRIASQILARQVRPIRRMSRKIPALALGALIVVTVAAPVAGLASPAMKGAPWVAASRRLAETAMPTLTYAVGSGAVAVGLGLLLAAFVGRSRGLRSIAIFASLALLAIPPALPALGFVTLAARSPAWADVALRSRATVGVALGLRLFPVAAIFAMRAWASMPASWAEAAGLQGVSCFTYLRRVAATFLLPSSAAAGLVVALLATADVTTVMLLHPPGEASMPLAIFTVMANAPGAFVAALCLFYVAAAGAVLALAWTLLGRRGA